MEQSQERRHDVTQLRCNTCIQNTTDEPKQEGVYVAKAGSKRDDLSDQGCVKTSADSDYFEGQCQCKLLCTKTRDPNSSLSQTSVTECVEIGTHRVRRKLL